MKFTKPVSKGKMYNFNYGWKFFLADAFPLKIALENHKNEAGRFFYEPEYNDDNWQSVGVPHTFNDGDMFVNRIEDAGTGQKRTYAFYRKWFKLDNTKDNKVLIEFEGIRQTCYLYVNGVMAGFSENGVAPFAFDISSYVKDGDNLIAIATDNTSTRNILFVSAETPNHPEAEPGTFIVGNYHGSEDEIAASEGKMPEFKKGVGFFWNCNDFNPSIGGLTKNIRLHVKPKVYLTLNVYSNLQTKGVYVYANDFDFKTKSAVINVEAEIRNETGAPVTAEFISVLVDSNGNVAGTIKSAPVEVAAAKLPSKPPLTITPKDAYVYENGEFKPINEEEAVAPTFTDSIEVTVANGNAKIDGLNFWNVNAPYLYDVYTQLIVDGVVMDTIKTTTGFRKMTYDGTAENGGLFINGERVWLTGYAQRSCNEWAAIGYANDWLKDVDARLVRESNANHIRWMHVAACPADIRSGDRYGVISAQPAGDKERENHGRQWDQRVELMRDTIIYFRNSPSILFWETGNNSVGLEHMREMTQLRKELDPNGGRWMGCRTINKREVVEESEFVGTMLNRHAGRFQSELMPILETEYAREESPRRVWDDYSPPNFDYDNVWIGLGGRKQTGFDVHDFTAEEFAVVTARGYSEFFNDRMQGASKKHLYSAAAALCWTDSAQHGRQSASENARMSGRVDAVRLKKQNFEAYRIMQSGKPDIKIMGHWNYPQEDGVNYRYPLKKFEGGRFINTGEYAFRDPKNKTIYVLGSYAISKIELYVNGELKGVCEKPINTFIFKFENIDVTASGYVMAKGYAYDGSIVEDRIDTTSEPAQIRLTPYTGENGLLADGVDIMFFDIEILDKAGRVCPLCYERIDFDITGDAKFLGGYNSGRFNGYGKNDSVIHQSHVFAECGINRVFVRAGVNASEIVLDAKMGGLTAQAKITSVSAPSCALIENSEPQVWEASKTKDIPTNNFTFEPIPAADAVKYTPDENIYSRIVINNGHEMDTKCRNPIFKDGAVWGPIIFVLDRLKNVAPGLDYTYDEINRRLTVISGGKKIVAEYGHTHLLIDGEENLMGGEPILNREIFWMELSAIIPHIDGITAQYDEGVHIYRIDSV